MSQCSKCGCEENVGCANVECPKADVYATVIAEQEAKSAKAPKVEKVEKVEEDKGPSRGFGK